MREARVDVWVDGEEGARIRRSLGAAGFAVRAIDELELDAESTPRVLIVAVDTPEEVGEILRRARSTIGGAPPTVVLLGPPDGDRALYPGADAFFPRNVAPSELVRTVRRFLSADASRSFPDETVEIAGRATVRLPANDVEPEPSARSMTAITMRRGVGTKRMPQRSEEAESHPRAPLASSERARRRRASERPPGGYSRLSDRLHELLAATDRRLHPEEEPFAWLMPGGDARPEELVPDDLLAIPDLAHAVPFQDGLEPLSLDEEEEASREISVEALGSSLTDLARAHTAPAGVSSAPALSELHLETGEADEALGTTADRYGALGRAVHILQHQLGGHPYRIRIADERGRPFTMHVRPFGVYRVDGPLHAMVVERLVAEGRFPEGAPAPTEQELSRWVVEDRVRVGDLVRVRREAVEALVAAICRAETGLLSVERMEGEDEAAAEPITRPLEEVVLEAVRSPGPHRVIEPRLRAHLVVLDRSIAYLAHQLRLRPEELAEIRAVEGMAYEDARARLSSREGLAAVLALLFHMGGASLEPAGSGAVARRDREAARRFVAGLEARAREGTYFEILGLLPTATAGEIAAARDRLVREIEALGADRLLGERPAAGRIAELRAGVEEAHAALRVDSWRVAYAAALAADRGER